MILDSNILIYALQANHEYLIELIIDKLPSVSIVSKIEVLGYHRLSFIEKNQFENIFDNLTVLPVTKTIADCAISLKQQQKMTLGDALIAATALEHQLTLVTRNIKDFQWIDGISMIDPIK